MQANIAWTDTRHTQLQVLDESLINYGLGPGDVALPLKDKPKSDGIPIWELDGTLQARFIEPTSCGWAQAYTSFLSAGKICYSLSPEKAQRVRAVGWIVGRLQVQELSNCKVLVDEPPKLISPKDLPANSALKTSKAEDSQ